MAIATGNPEFDYGTTARIQIRPVTPSAGFPAFAGDDANCIKYCLYLINCLRALIFLLHHLLMFIGHFGVGFGAKTVAPTVSLGTLFLAAQFLDLLWPSLLLLGVETVRIEPGATVVTPLVFEHYPVSHSLIAVLGWAVLVGAMHFVLLRQRIAALVLAGLVVSHWVLDAIVHQPDLPLFPGSAAVVGLNLWSSLASTLLVESALFALGVWLYACATTPSNAVGRWGLVALVIFLAGVYAGNLFGAPPPSPEAIAWIGQLQWLLVLWGYWIDKHRHVAVRA
ncbi:MAG TPA: hypothetical protein VMV48_03765 [Gallionellaceae bacterium]|nr:hypothetical protein [Gallionellaceae bacterium]